MSNIGNSPWAMVTKNVLNIKIKGSFDYFKCVFDLLNYSNMLEMIRAQFPANLSRIIFIVSII